MRTLDILLDADDVLLDTLPAWVEYLNDLHGTDVSAEDVRFWDMQAAFPDLSPQQIYEPLRSGWFWYGVRAKEGAADGVRRLAEDGHRLYIATAGYPEAEAARRALLCRLFPSEHIRDIINIRCKHLLRGDALIDDNPENLTGGAYTKLLFDMPHNQAFDAEAHGITRVRDWDEAYAALSSLRSRDTVVINKEWAMPNSKTFQIPPIRRFVEKYCTDGAYVVDPFANESKYGTITNDLNPEYDTNYHMDALDFLRMLPSESADVVLYDPPYSLRQVSECYKGVGIAVTQETTQASWRAKHLDEISRVLKRGGYALCFGWNTAGVGKKRGFEQEEILIVSHGGSKNDTLCVADRKL